MKAIADSGLARVAAVADPSPEARERALESAPDALEFSSSKELLELELDGLVIATPSALHPEQSVAALEKGIAVFCQKPLGRTEMEVRRIIDAARRADVLLGIDFSYRYAKAFQAVRKAIDLLGHVYAADLVFHNAYGPDKAWFYDAKLSGGGCVMDLGVHLVDLALQVFQSPVSNVSSQLFRGGKPVAPGRAEVEDYATARIDFESGATAHMACSWNLHAGCDCVIEASFYGEKAGASVRNLNGSFTEFTAELFSGTTRKKLAEGSDEWGGRVAIDWAWQLAEGRRFDPGVAQAAEVAAVLDAIYKDPCRR